jgi:hypothetical protein
MIAAPSRRSSLRSWLAWAAALLIAAGSARALAGNLPLQYLDEETGATVTAVGRPLVFVGKGSHATARDASDFITLAAAAVDQSGKISYVMIAYFWSTGGPRPPEDTAAGAPQVVLQVDDRRVELAPHGGSAREVGIGVPVHPPPLGGATPWVYDIDLATVRLISESRQVALHWERKSLPLDYELFEDRRVALKQFALLMGADH